jgi:hypothetical protein
MVGVTGRLGQVKALPSTREGSMTKPPRKKTTRRKLAVSEGQSGTSPLAFRLVPKLKDALVKAARDDRRSVSSLCQKVLIEWLAARGYWEED